MGLMQAAYRTYESQRHRVGLVEEGQEPLAPIAHAIMKAQIEIVISDEGRFQSAHPVNKKDAKTIIPVTIDSASRTSTIISPHPLSDQLAYLASFGGEKHEAYAAQLEQWADADFSHPKVRAVHSYIRSGTIVDDLVMSGVVERDERGQLEAKKIEGMEYAKCLIRWRVIPAPEGVRSACYEDEALFGCFTDYYVHQCANMAKDTCLITGDMDIVCVKHPKGTVSANNGAKLISANDNSGFTYRGRFTQADQAYSVGYLASQKAHNALRWVTANFGVTMGGRMFVCWNPNGGSAPLPTFMAVASESGADFPSYKRQLLLSLGSYRQALKPEDDVVIAALDAATTGRLSITYFNELKASDFLDRLEAWYETFRWRFYPGIQSPSIKRVVECAFGTQREKFIECDEKVLKQHVQRLLHCVLDRRLFPPDIVKALVVKASNPLCYSVGNRETIWSVACAAICKYRNDLPNEEEWTLALDPNCKDRSYLFGRLLAVAELAERRTYEKDEKREPNAIRMQAVFSQRPMYAWRIIEESLIPYFMKLPPQAREYYRKLLDKIKDELPTQDDPELDRRLDDVYLLGQSHQRTAIYQGKWSSDNNEEENANEPAASQD